MPQKQKKISLVLGAGSARGLAHIGVIQVLEENNVPIDCIVGSSMGAMVGGVYACGVDMKMLGRMLQHMDMNILFDLKIPRIGFIAGNKISDFLNLLTKKKRFEDLELPLAMVATDLISGQEVVMREGSIAEAIRASISIPGVFCPVKREGMVLVDGAVLNRLPVETAHNLGASSIVAVDVSFSESKQVIVNNAMDVIMTSLDLMQKQQFDLIYDKADILIQPEVGNFSPRDFNRVGDLIALGRKAAEDKIEEIKKALF
jgi:NTE family protein